MRRQRWATAWCVLAGFLAGACGGERPPGSTADQATANPTSTVASGESALQPSASLDHLLDGSIWLRPAAARPRVVAYASWESHRIYIEHAFRDRVQNLLEAHISVSTGHWRIRLPGDPPGEPLTPGVPDREFEAWSIEERPAGSTPGRRDFRVVLGEVAVMEMAFECRPAGATPSVSPTSGRFAGGPWTVSVTLPHPDALVVEDLREIGQLEARSADCQPVGGTVPAMIWTPR